MKTITVLLAACVLAVGSGYALAAEQSPVAASSDIQKLVGTWKGTQGQKRVEATFTFWIEQDRLFGKSEYLDLHQQNRMKGALSDISVSDDIVRFAVKFSGGDLAGATAVYELKLEGSSLKGRARNLDARRAIKEFGVFLKKSD